MSENNKVLAIMGNSGSGKTTASIKLALELAKHKKNVIVVLCDPFTSVIPYIMPANTDIDTSLGMLLTAPGLTQTDILEACVPIRQNDYISLLGYKAGENLITYPKITRDKAVDFFVMLRHLADYVIIDCAAVFEADIVSIVGIETADKVVRMLTSNLKGISYYQSHMPMLTDSAYRANSHLKAISMLKPWQEWKSVSQQYGGTDFILPYVLELEKQFDEVSLFEQLTSKETIPYTTELQKIINSVFGLQGMSVKNNLANKEHKLIETTSEKPQKQQKPIRPKSISINISFGKNKGEF